MLWITLAFLWVVIAFCFYTHVVQTSLDMRITALRADCDALLKQLNGRTDGATLSEVLDGVLLNEEGRNVYYSGRDDLNASGCRATNVAVDRGPNSITTLQQFLDEKRGGIGERAND